MNKQYHRGRKTFGGKHCFHSFALLRSLVLKHRTRDILDFGIGKGRNLKVRDILLLDHRDAPQKTLYPSWQEALGVDEIYPYDPCVSQYAALPSNTSVLITPPYG